MMHWLVVVRVLSPTVLLHLLLLVDDVADLGVHARARQHHVLEHVANLQVRLAVELRETFGIVGHAEAVLPGPPLAVVPTPSELRRLVEVSRAREVAVHTSRPEEAEARVKEISDAVIA
eukprot:CAMPEP_0180548196 /NCGR_PEP_ID=MMETSP1036_2-20121128/71489_1 /TAXON_ID=632150 /ORGANISM="Azadinium spinosum, Strain 3D9" /LENGTH=118 /DNA_ID=CAMNT_0022563379 /DNA_START=142 /DNA_END=498 /DNA_ORIENTATION=+